MFPIDLFGVNINQAKSAQNLGVIFDNNFSFRSHKSAACSSCFYHIWDLQRVRHHLDRDSAKLLATAFVSSCLDYCNSLLYVIADADLTKLQCVQNRLANIVIKSPPFTHSAPLLRSLQWLPVKFTFHSILATSLPSHSRRSNKGISLSVLGSRPTQAQEHFTLMPLLFRTTSRCLSVQPFQLLPSRSIWRHISLSWPFPHRHQHTRWPIDVMELLHRFCC